jgi:4-amino-4-deoxy-L-arabinose transferase-like glycosyltransferase
MHEPSNPYQDSLIGSSELDRFTTRHFQALAWLVLAVAALNLSFALTAETVAEWDESLYALSATEMLDSGNWIVTTFDGKVDYYNSKPPLNVWILALSFKVLGTHLLSLRLVAAIAAWTTVLVLIRWAKHAYGPTVALFAGVVLSTTFGFLHVHSGRSGNPDALMTLLMLLVVVATGAGLRRGWALSAIGPLLAGVFLLKGMAVLMPLAFVGVMLLWRYRTGQRPIPWWPLGVAGILFVAPTLSWAAARYRVDGWQFLRLLVTQDLVAAATTPLDGHGAQLYYYANVLQRFHYDWLLVGLVVVVLQRRLIWRHVSKLFQTPRLADDRTVMLLTWAALTFGVPSIMQTKLAWYLNPFYPMFALGLAWLLKTGLCQARSVSNRRIVVLAVVVALLVAEGKLLWHPVNKRSLQGTTQELLMLAADDVCDGTVFADNWTAAERFVLRGIVKATPGRVRDVDAFLQMDVPNAVWLSNSNLKDVRLETVRTNGRESLYRRRSPVRPKE